MEEFAEADKAPSALADAEGGGAGLVVGSLDEVAGLGDQHRNVDGGEGVGTGDDQEVAGRQAGERLAGPQYRQRTFEATQIVGLFHHQQWITRLGRAAGVAKIVKDHYYKRQCCH